MSESGQKWFILLFYRSIGSLSIGELHSSEEGEGYAVTVVVLQRKKSHVRSAPLLL